MIIREREREYILIPQHNHAFLSGKLATHFKKDFFKSEDHMEEVITAIYEHDRGWITLDQAPLWNEQKEAPFSFADYPLTPKLNQYRIGVDEIQEMSAYAALLCSMHYCTFFSEAKDKHGLEFLKDEEIRQKQIMEKVNRLDMELLHQHFRLLQVCDDISLYVCLNEPGASKKNEHLWFKNGFSKSEPFNDGRHPLYGKWIDQERISVRAFPFVNEFQTSLEYKVVSKADINTKGLEHAYSISPAHKQSLSFVKFK
ncbi:DUF3891 family protein [Alkalihalobacillus deserti]|uniref:DUF3891 family protein n=1 Tax=Alkalihalobacillus deserti TaxID=2879466 RepID=UPI001D13B1A8|nr:DUF3891 family protein [Alkalihalobacillus deserti]